MLKKLFLFMLLLLFGFLLTSNLHAYPITGYSETIISNIVINFSDIDALNISRKGMYPMELNGTHAESLSQDLKNGTSDYKIVASGTALANSGNAHSAAGITFTDISGLPLTNKIYSGITYNSFAYGSTDWGNSIRSYSIINDTWFFTVTAPVVMSINFDYYMFASGPIISPYGELITETTVGLGVGRQNTTFYSPPGPDGYNDNGVKSGSLSMMMAYNQGDSGLIYIWTGSDVLSHQSGPAPVPEPASMLLFGTGGIVFLGYLRRSLKKK